MNLLDLPQEILALIFQHIGPAELPKSIDFLLVSRAWYWAVLPVYLSRLQLSTIYVLSNDLERFPRPNTNPSLSQAIQQRVTRLTLCVDGLPSRETLSWEDQREFSAEAYQRLDETIYRHRNGCSKTLRGRLMVVFAEGKIQSRIEDHFIRWSDHFEGEIFHRYRVRDEEAQEVKELECRLSNWRGLLNDRLFRFAEILSAFKELREIKIETTLTPRWDYIFAPSMGKLLTHLPSNVTTLTLDTHASRFLTLEDGSEPVHICAIISQRIDHFQTVRIRMRSVCPSILEMPINSPNTISRLKTLVIRLYLPDHMGPFDDTHNGRHPDFNAVSCCPGEKLLYREMILAGLQLAKARPSMTGVRISYKHLEKDMLVVADCKEEAAFYHPHSTDYEDGALVEGPWEDSLELGHDQNSFMHPLPT